jgi:hypothetical protein
MARHSSAETTDKCCATVAIAPPRDTKRSFWGVENSKYLIRDERLTCLNHESSSGFVELVHDVFRRISTNRNRP